MKNIFVTSGYTGPKYRNEKQFYIPNVHKTYKGEESLKVFAPRIWELVPDEQKRINNIDKFKVEIKKWQPIQGYLSFLKVGVGGEGSSPKFWRFLKVGGIPPQGT